MPEFLQISSPHKPILTDLTDHFKPLKAFLGKKADNPPAQRHVGTRVASCFWLVAQCGIRLLIDSRTALNELATGQLVARMKKSVIITGFRDS